MSWSHLLPESDREIVYPEFQTHLNYVKFLESESAKLALICGNNLKKPICTEDSRLKKKLKIINVTLANIRSEYRSVIEEPEYSEVCCAWIPVKSYYLIFHTFLVLGYLIQCDGKALLLGHDESRKMLKAFLGDHTLSFTNQIFNEVVLSGEASSWLIQTGANLRTANANLDDYKRLILRKLFEYKKEEIRRSKKVKRLTQRVLESIGFSGVTMALFEFFYFYRIKVNYRDLEFMQEGLSPDQYKDFYVSYVNLTSNFYRALQTCINQLSVARFGKTIL